MLHVTNGSISRTVKPADYEARTVTLSFNCNPDDDIDVGLAKLSALAEKHARAMPGNPVQDKKRLTGDEIVGNAHPPTPAPIVPAPTPVSVSEPAPEPVAPAPTEKWVIPTAEDLVAAAQAAVKRVGVERRHEVTAIVNKYVDQPNMPIRSTPEAKRVSLIADLAKLGAGSDY